MQTRAEGDAARRHPAKAGLAVRPGHAASLRRQQSRYAILFIAPGLAVYLVFMVYPFLNTIYLSLTNWNGVTPRQGFGRACELREDGRGRGCPEGVLSTTSSG